MTTVLCTLYNSLYLDKGLVLYDSLCNCAKDFKLYVLCMDDKCYEVLTDLHQEYHIPVKLSDFEAGDDALLEAKSNRPIGEYCWTCSSSFIRYILRHYGEDSCTYIDADMFFYNDPQVLIDEMSGAGKSVMVVPHRFPEVNKEMAKTVGEYCVEFNTFLNDTKSLEVLEFWRAKCLDCCSNLGDGVHWGDQKYLEELVDRFNCVHVCRNKGAGVAPWNITGYHGESNRILFEGEVIMMVFYHFQGISYFNRKYVSIGVSKRKGLDIKLVKRIYNDYLEAIERKKCFLKSDFGLDCVIYSHPSLKHRLAFWGSTNIGKLLMVFYRKLVLKAIYLRVK